MEPEANFEWCQGRVVPSVISLFNTTVFVGTVLPSIFLAIKGFVKEKC